MTKRQRVIVCGGRKYADKKAITEALTEPIFVKGNVEDGAMIVTGGATGADQLAKEVALGAKRGLIVESHDADWKRYGKRAGPIRNQEMVNLGAAFCIAFPGGRGTADCVERCLAAGIPVIHHG